jgi:anti-sigma regulatory factor (Ser/Thr protein kinase)
MRDALLIEDGPVTGRLLTRALRSAALRLTALRGSDAALRWARSHLPSVIVVGATGTGKEEGLVRALKLAPDTWGIPVVRLRLAPGPAPALEVEADVELGAPVDVEGLRQAVQRALARAAEQARAGTRAEVRLNFRSELALLGEVNQLLAGLLQAAGLGPRQVQRLTHAVREVAANAIEWGHRLRPERRVALTCRLRAEQVVVVVRDTGPGFDPRVLPHAARADDPVSHLAERAARGLREGGFGLLLAGGLVDELSYNETGNEARLVMRFGPAPRGVGPALSAVSRGAPISGRA